MPLKKIIGLSGKAESGKDLTAALLSMYGYRKISFAESLRQEISKFLTEDVTENIPKRLLVLRGALRTMGQTDVTRKPTPLLMRKLMQWWGDWRREQDPYYFVKKSANPTDYVVYSDVRFPEESLYVTRMGGVLWRVERPGKTKLKTRLFGGHKSETSMDGTKFNTVIKNTGDMQFLATQIRNNIVTD